MNREHWLTKAVEELSKEFFAPDKMEFASPIRISTGWCRGSKKAIGQCWSNKCSAGDFVEIFIAPNIHEPVQVLATTLHELIHAHLGNHKGHGKDFKAVVNKFGLSGRVTATFASEGSDLFNKLQQIAKSIGDYPHKQLTPGDTSTKKEGEAKGGWIRFKSRNADSYRCMVSPKSLEEFGIPKDPWGEELVPTKGE
jgi:hypothetical protein